MSLATKMKAQLPPPRVEEYWRSVGYYEVPRNKEAYAICCSIIEEAVKEGCGSILLYLDRTLESQLRYVDKGFNYEAYALVEMLKQEGFEVIQNKVDEDLEILVSWTKDPRYPTKKKEGESIVVKIPQ